MILNDIKNTRTIFREHKKGGCECETFVGNPFINHLINIKDENDRIDWKEISLRTLEGGKSAFGERGQIYGLDFCDNGVSERDAY